MLEGSARRIVALWARRLFLFCSDAMEQTTTAAGAIAVGREAIAHDDAAKGITQQNNGGGGGGAAKALHEHRHEHRHRSGHQTLRGSQPISA